MSGRGQTGCGSYPARQHRGTAHSAPSHALETEKLCDTRPDAMELLALAMLAATWRQLTAAAGQKLVVCTKQKKNGRRPSRVPSSSVHRLARRDGGRQLRSARPPRGSLDRRSWASRGRQRVTYRMKARHSTTNCRWWVSRDRCACGGPPRGDRRTVQKEHEELPIGCADAAGAKGAPGASRCRSTSGARAGEVHHGSYQPTVARTQLKYNPHSKFI